jgi:hypothetical protein
MTLSGGPTEVPTPGLSPGGPDIDGWNVVAQEPIVIPPLSEGLIKGKIEKSNGVDLPQEVLIEPLGLGTPGAYVARVASRDFTPGELEELRSLDGGYLGGSDRKSGTSGNSERADRGMTVRKGNGARYCVLKVLNTGGQYLELRKIYAWDRPSRLEGFRPRKQELISATRGGKERPTFGSAPLAQETLRNSGKLERN